jgi:hypothetical protein
LKGTLPHNISRFYIKWTSVTLSSKIRKGAVLVLLKITELGSAKLRWLHVARCSHQILSISSFTDIIRQETDRQTDRQMETGDVINETPITGQINRTAGM